MDEQVKNLVTAYELSKKLSIPISWILRESKQNKIPHIKADNVLIFDLPVVTELLRQRAAFENFSELPERIL
jgi:hypothetical protein